MVRFIWERPEWPHFVWDASALGSSLAAAYRAQGEVLGAVRHLAARRREQLELEARTVDALDTSRIEGESLDPASVRSSVARRLRLALAKTAPRTADGEAIAAVTIDATRRADRALTVARLDRWHHILFARSSAGRRRGFRRQAMQVVSGPIGRQRVHFEAPPPERLADEVAAFVRWSESSTAHPEPLIAAAVAHLWFVTIHPYDDGNGRISRAIADLMLARAFPEVTRYVSVTRQIAGSRKEYYHVLERTQRGALDITRWLLWFLDAYTRAAQATLEVIDETARAVSVWAHAGPLGLSERQAAVVARLLDGFEGKLTSRKYAVIAHVSEDTALRDLGELTDKGVLLRSGSGKSTRYELAPNR